jgi:hypothetical protein
MGGGRAMDAKAAWALGSEEEEVGAAASRCAASSCMGVCACWLMVRMRLRKDEGRWEGGENVAMISSRVRMRGIGLLAVPQ